jgi:hypothetical protein
MAFFASSLDDEVNNTLIRTYIEPFPKNIGKQIIEEIILFS